MDARKDILSRLRSRSREQAGPAPFRSRQQFDDLGAAFEKALVAVGGQVHRCQDLESGLAFTGQILKELAVQTAVVNQEPPLDRIEFTARWPQISWYRASEADDNLDYRQRCAEADIGLSGAEAGLAETGTIVLHSGPGRSRLATLLPPVHLALLPENKLLTDLFAWAKTRPGTMPSNVTMVSGPSKTADIEQTLSVGVHGPKRFIVVLYQAFLE